MSSERLRKISMICKGVVLFALYYTTARFGLSIGAVSTFASLIWIPTGLSIASLIIFGYSLWPAVAIAAFAANFATHAPFFVACGMALGNTLEAIAGAYIFLRVIGSHTGLNKRNDILALVVLVAPF